MKNRTLPYGYCCKDGVIVIEPQESKVLKRIFAEYLGGSSMLTIAEQLNREKIEYRDGVTDWNKGRLKHLIDNTKYLGTEVYPPIIDQAIYEKMRKTKHGRNTQKNTNKAQDIFKLTVPVRCPSCGDRMRRRHDSRYEYAKEYESLCADAEQHYTAMLLKNVKYCIGEIPCGLRTEDLPERWPVWGPVYSGTDEIKSDPRWDQWAEKCRQ